MKVDGLVDGGAAAPTAWTSGAWEALGADGALVVAGSVACACGTVVERAWRSDEVPTGGTRGAAATLGGSAAVGEEGACGADRAKTADGFKRGAGGAVAAS